MPYDQLQKFDAEHRLDMFPPINEQLAVDHVTYMSHGLYSNREKMCSISHCQPGQNWLTGFRLQFPTLSGSVSVVGNEHPGYRHLKQMCIAAISVYAQLHTVAASAVMICNVPRLW